MDFDEYMRLATRTAKKKYRYKEQQLFDFGLGIAGESGEIAEKLKKAIRDDGGRITAERRAALKQEIGDVLWYLSQLSRVLGLSFNDIAEANIARLADRKKRDVIKGSGDNR